MVNVLLVTYGVLGLGLLSTAERILGMGSRIWVIPFLAGEDVKVLQDKVYFSFQKFSGGEVLIMTDIKGGIPWQACLGLPDDCSFTLLSGVNVPMLIETILLMSKAGSAEQLAELVCAIEDKVQVTKLITQSPIIG